GAFYVVGAAYPFVLHRRARNSREPYLPAAAASGFFFVAARTAFLQGGLNDGIGTVPVGGALVLALMLKRVLRSQGARRRDTRRVALVAASALAFATVAIPLQLRHQWITIGWALEGVALAWLYDRMRFRALAYAAAGLLTAVFVRLALNPAVFVYE